MKVFDPLGLELIQLADSLAPFNIPLIVGGGYGLLLRQQFVEEQGIKTLYALPEARATQDLDIFLSLELIADRGKMIRFRDMLSQCGYQAIEGVKYYQFIREMKYVGRTGSIKVDLLAPPPEDPFLRKQMRVDSRRIRSAKHIHAHTTPEAFPEAFSISDDLIEMSLSSMEEKSAKVFLPNTFTYFLLKLFVYRDRRNDKRTDFGIYHAFDLYRIIAMMTEEDGRIVKKLSETYADHQVYTEASDILEECFSKEQSSGSIAILEHSRRVEANLTSENIVEFLTDIRTYFLFE